MARQLTIQEMKEFADHVVQLREAETQEINPYTIAKPLLARYQDKIGGLPNVPDFYHLMRSHGVPLANYAEARKILDHHRSNIAIEDSEMEEYRHI